MQSLCLMQNRELERISALAARTNINNRHRAIVKFNIFATRTLRMFIGNYFSTSQPYHLRHALHWKSCALEYRATAGSCRQLSNA